MQKGLKMVLQLYQVGLVARLIVTGLLTLIEFEEDNTTAGLVLVSALVIIYKIPQFLFLYILFKMKKIEIMLDYNQAFDRKSVQDAGFNIKQFQRYSKIFLVLFTFNVLIVILLFTCLFLEYLNQNFQFVLVVGLSFMVAVTQVLLFCLFQMLQVYFYRMGLKYIKILRDVDERISMKKSKWLFATIIVVIFFQSLHMMLLFVILFF